MLTLLWWKNFVLPEFSDHLRAHRRWLLLRKLTRSIVTLWFYWGCSSFSFIVFELKQLWAVLVTWWVHIRCCQSLWDHCRMVIWLALFLIRIQWYQHPLLISLDHAELSISGVESPISEILVRWELLKASNSAIKRLVHSLSMWRAGHI